MGIESLSRFHWIVIGALLGVAISYLWVAAADPNGEGDSRAFVSDVVRKDPKSGTPLISGIVIHPPQTDYRGKIINLVTYKRLAQDKQGKLWWIDKHFYAGVPFNLGRPPEGVEAAQYTVQTYLTELAKRPELNFIKFHDGWWYIPKYAVSIGAIGGIVLIGGIWPTLLWVMANAGLGRRMTVQEFQQMQKEKEAKKSNSLWRYKSKSAPATTGTGGRPVITAADQAELEAVANAYEKNVGENAVTSSASSGVGQSATSQTMQNIVATPLEATPVRTEKDDQIEVKNREYYPTLVHHHKEDKKTAGGKADEPKAR